MKKLLLLQIKHSRTEVNTNWKVNALEYLEPHIQYFAKRYQYKDMSFDDYYQELVSHIWDKMDKFDPEGKAKIETWASVVMRNKCISIWRKRTAKKRIGDLRVYG